MELLALFVTTCVPKGALWKMSFSWFLLCRHEGSWWVWQKVKDEMEAKENDDWEKSELADKLIRNPLTRRWESTPCRRFADKLHDRGFFMCLFLCHFFCQQSSTNKAAGWDDQSTCWNIRLNRIYGTVAVPASFEKVLVGGTLTH